MTLPTMYELLQRFADLSRLPGRLLCVRLDGSRSFNVHSNASAFDFIGVYAGPGRDDRFRPGRAFEIDGSGGNRNFFHEVGNFSWLLADGDAKTVEALFVHQNHYSVPCAEVTGLWQELVDRRSEFLTVRTVKSCLKRAAKCWHRVRPLVAGDSSGLPARMASRLAYSTIRALLDARDVAGGAMQVWRHSDSEDRQFLMAVKSGDCSIRDVDAVRCSLIETVEAMRPWRLPEMAPHDWTVRWLRRVREAARTVVAEENEVKCVP